MSQAGNLEVEVKFLVSDLQAVRARLAAAGARPVKPRLYEHNVRFDDDDGTLLQRGQLLRLRQDDGARLTFKGPALAGQASEAKVREELETTVGDFETVAEILQRLGFKPQQVYEKYRQTFVLGHVEAVLDELPFGNFVELEGDEEQIRAAAQALELPWSSRILDNYLLLMARVKAYYGLPFDDLTFANFAGIEVSLAEALARS